MNKLLLIVLDGFGLNFNQDQNPVLTVDTPTLDHLISSYPFTTLQASGEEVGLSWGEVGNSEVGHFNMGAGQMLWQNLPKIDQSIESGDFFKNKVLTQTMGQVKKNNSSLHLIGLVSDGGIHSHINHLIALMQLAKDQGLEKVFIHMISDGRDTAPKLANSFIKQLEAKSAELGVGQISTISGRSYAMDRDNNWSKIEQFYNTLVGASDQKFKTAAQAVENSYNQDLDDEKVVPSIIDWQTEAQFIRDNDGIIIFNFRADRAREMTRAIGDPNLTDFSRSYFPQQTILATMTPYEQDWKMDIQTVFEPPKSDYPVSLIISDQSISQYHTSESEKQAHITYFFNGGNQQKYPLEEHQIIDSPASGDYVQQPEMSLPLVADNLSKVLMTQKYDFILTNFANPDMVGHTGNFQAAQQAIVATDKYLGQVLQAASQAGYVTLVTSDHGNVEQMKNPTTNKPDKEHTINSVPFFWLENYQAPTKNRDSLALWQEISQLNPTGVLIDVTATILNQLQIPQPEFIVGQELSQALSRL